MFDRVIDLIMEFAILAMQFFAILLVFAFFSVSIVFFIGAIFNTFVGV